MANNRLYILNTVTNEYLCIAKDFGDGFRLGNVDLLKNFINCLDESDINELKFITEDNENFNEKNYRNVNFYNTWTYL